MKKEFLLGVFASLFLVGCDQQTINSNNISDSLDNPPVIEVAGSCNQDIRRPGRTTGDIEYRLVQAGGSWNWAEPFILFQTELPKIDRLSSATSLETSSNSCEASESLLDGRWKDAEDGFLVIDRVELKLYPDGAYFPDTYAQALRKPSVLESYEGTAKVSHLIMRSRDPNEIAPALVRDTQLEARYECQEPYIYERIIRTVKNEVQLFHPDLCVPNEQWPDIKKDCVGLFLRDTGSNCQMTTEELNILSYDRKYVKFRLLADWSVSYDGELDLKLSVE